MSAFEPQGYRRTDEALDYLLDGTLPAAEEARAERAELDAYMDRWADYYDARPYPLAGWYAPGAARASLPRTGRPGRVAAAPLPSGSNQTSSQEESS